MLVKNVNATPILEFKCEDTRPWFQLDNGSGAPFEIVDSFGDYGDPNNWRSSVDTRGSPGGRSSAPPGVVVNEILSHTDLLAVDAIKIFNPTGMAIDVGGCWLSDSDRRFDEHIVAPETMFPPNGYAVFTDMDFNSSGNPLKYLRLNAARGESVFLV